MRVRLTRRLAECVDGIDLSQTRVGDFLDLSPHDGKMLIAEGWAMPVGSAHRAESEREPRAVAADRSRSPKATSRTHVTRRDGRENPPRCRPS